MLTLAKLEKIIEAACKEGIFHEDHLYEYEPHTTAKLLADRKALLEAAEKTLSRMVPHSSGAILLRAAIESAHAGWPTEPKTEKKDEPHT